MFMITYDKNHSYWTFLYRLMSCFVFISCLHVQMNYTSNSNQHLGIKNSIPYDTPFTDSISHALSYWIGGSKAWAIPPRSMSLQKSGDARVGDMMPWFSGWDLTERPVNLYMVLNQNKKGYVMMLCATWCTACHEGMRMLINARHQLALDQIQVILTFSENITLSHLTIWLNEQIPPQFNRLNALQNKKKSKKNLSRKTKKDKKQAKGIKDAHHMAKGNQKPAQSAWDNLLIIQDRYLMTAKYLGSYKEDTEDKSKQLDLPRVVVFDQQGVVTGIFYQEGYDFIDQIRSSLE